MSTRKTSIFVTLFTAVLALFSAAIAGAQSIEVTITIDAVNRSAGVSGKWAADAGSGKNLSFVPSAIGVPDLGSRISNVRLSTKTGVPVNFRRFNPAEYVAESDFAAFGYDVALTPSADVRSAAHSSWVAAENGVLFLDQLLPTAPSGTPKRASVSIRVPDGWQVLSSKASSDGRYDVDDVERGVFVLAKSIRRASLKKNGIDLFVSGRWMFEDDEAAEMAAAIYREYAELFEGKVGERAAVFLIPIPQTGVQRGTWEAETRGSTVLIASSDTAFKGQSLQRLHEQLRHEIFHLWVPNGVNLSGKYDWFYEGFALYGSLKTGVRLNQIRFDDFLDTLSRAHSIDRSETRRRSLIDASRERWSGADTQVYARGMVVAFLCDLVLLQGSNAKTSVETLLARLYAAHRPPAKAEDGNAAILQILESYPGLSRIADDYVRGAKPIEWAETIENAGLENDPATSRTNLRIKTKLSGRQKALLDKLGYNNWRKLTRK